jgi:hypothetical protein
MDILEKRRFMFPKGRRKVAEMRPTVFVDPGLGGTGFAFFPAFCTDCGYKSNQATAPGAIGVIHGSDGAWECSVRDITGEFQGLLAAVREEYNVRGKVDVVFELPELWGGSAKSLTAATNGHDGEPASLFKQTYLVGALAQVAQSVSGNLPILISPQEWKGQLPKDAVEARIMSVLELQDIYWHDGKKRKKLRDHECDAVGMGLAAQGAL